MDVCVQAHVPAMNIDLCTCARAHVFTTKHVHVCIVCVFIVCCYTCMFMCAHALLPWVHTFVLVYAHTYIIFGGCSCLHMSTGVSMGMSALHGCMVHTYVCVW